MSNKKIEIQIDDDKIKFAVWAIGATFAGYFAANALYIENHEMQTEKETFEQRVYMSESTRYAEIAKYYRDEMKHRELTEAEWARLELVEKQQCRIRNTIAGTDPGLCN